MTTLSSLFAVWFEVSPTNGGIQIFCQQDNCVFGWTSSRWVVEMLVFGFTVGVVHIAGFNYAVCFLFHSMILSLHLILDLSCTSVDIFVVGSGGPLLDCAYLLRPGGRRSAHSSDLAGRSDRDGRLRYHHSRGSLSN